MSRLTLRLPETLHQQLTHQAEREGVSLNQYIVYALTRQVSQNYTVQALSAENIDQQEQNFKNLSQELGNITTEDIQSILEKRDKVTSENELTSEVIAQFKQKIQETITA